eukprot:1186766-Prorocentrum_minimum.AAC.2
MPTSALTSTSAAPPPSAPPSASRVKRPTTPREEERDPQGTPRGGRSATNRIQPRTSSKCTCASTRGPRAWPPPVCVSCPAARARRARVAARPAPDVR